VAAGTGGGAALLLAVLAPLRAGDLVSRLVWVFAFWLRLRARARRDTARYRYVTAALGAIPAARLEVVHPDGSLLRVTGTTSEGADHAAR